MRTTRIFLLATVAQLAFSSHSFLHAEESAKAVAIQDLRFGEVDIQKVILNVDEGKKAKAALEKEAKDVQADLMGKQKELEKMNSELQEQAALLTEEAKQKKQQEFQKKIMELKNAEMQFNQEFPRRQSDAAQKIGAKAAAIAERLGKEQGLYGVRERNSSGWIYLNNSVDLTDKVIAEYEKSAATVASKETSDKKKS